MKKKDLNYVAGLEKAIKKKYGELAVQNPASGWDSEKEQEYLKQLEALVEKQQRHKVDSEPENVNGILISRKLLTRESITNCPVCRTKIKTINDDIYLVKFECCEKCYFQHVDGREERWLEGWRPNNAKTR